jgi:hypothetical protein
MRTTLDVSAIALVLSSVFISGAPVLAAGAGGPGAGADTGTVSPTSGNYGTTTGSGDSVQQIQQMLNDAEAKTKTNADATTNGSGNSGTASESPAAPYEPPFTSNPGTMAESAKTTAFSTSTYHQ